MKAYEVNVYGMESRIYYQTFSKQFIRTGCMNNGVKANEKKRKLRVFKTKKRAKFESKTQGV